MRGLPWCDEPGDVQVNYLDIEDIFCTRGRKGYLEFCVLLVVETSLRTLLKVSSRN